MQQLHKRGVLFAAFLAVLGALTVWVEPAQAQLLQGSITGNVTDASQAAVVGAKVVATEQTTNFTRDTTTNGAGAYNLPTMPPGTYTITVTAPSFQTSTDNWRARSAGTSSPNQRGSDHRPIDAKCGSLGRRDRLADGPRRHPRRRNIAYVAERAGADRAQLPDAVRHGPGCLAADQFEFLYRQFQSRTDYLCQRRKHRTPTRSASTVRERST